MGWHACAMYALTCNVIVFRSFSTCFQFFSNATFNSGSPSVIGQPTPKISYFDAPILFIDDVKETKLSNQLPYLYNKNGVGEQKNDKFGVPIELAPLDPTRALGTKYSNVLQRRKTIHPGTPNAYDITEFNFQADEAVYQPLLATEETVQAFGMTLLKSGECIHFPYQDMWMNDYIYGKWAGYQSPYLEGNRGRELLPHNPTDLEYHNFANVFFSRGPLPLVISVARWRPYVGQIWLADLWLMPGNAIVLPPKLTPDAPQPGASEHDKYNIVIDLHGNRNSALACRFVDGAHDLTTTTILAGEAAMKAAATRPHYHEEKNPTRHDRLPLLGWQAG
jgi:hypothetical protein